MTLATVDWPGLLATLKKFTLEVKAVLFTVTIEPMILLFVLSFSITNSSQIMTDLLIGKVCRSSQELFILNDTSPSGKVCDDLGDPSNQEFKDLGKCQVTFSVTVSVSNNVRTLEKCLLIQTAQKVSLNIRHLVPRSLISINIISVFSFYSSMQHH